MSKWDAELRRFDGLWRGGYMEQVTHVTQGIREYVGSLGPLGRCLEIGCGGGFWSGMLSRLSSSLVCIDIQSAEFNCFWSRVPGCENIVYHQVDNPDLLMLERGSLDFVFSYGVFCHLTPEMQVGYLRSSFRRCKRGARAMIMYADSEKYAASGGKVRQGPRWHWVGKEWWCDVAERAGWVVEVEDLGLDSRHPITLLSKG